jgi:putative hydroxymethylpyrimidine transport system substrate-binding protein
VTRFVIAVCVLVALAGCGEKVDVLRPKTERQFQLMLDYFPNADHAPIYAAQARGDFKVAGLDLKIRQPADP